MTKYLLNRSGQIFITLILFLTLIFFLINAQPGGIANVLALNPNVPPDHRANIQRQFGQDKPIVQQYFSYLRNFFTGNLGVSFSLYPRSVNDIIKERLPRTVVLFVTAAVIAFYLGFAMGKIIAWRRGGFTEYAATIGGVTLFTIFTPWFGLMMIWLFAVKIGWFPIGQFIEPNLWRTATVTGNQVFISMLLSAFVLSVVIAAVYVVATKMRLRHRNVVTGGAAFVSFGLVLIIWSVSGVGFLAADILKHMILPVATLTAISFAGTMLITRNSMLETMREDYVMAARAKGLSDRQVRDKHVARNALLPVVTNFVLSIAFAIDGSVVIESIFSWKGMGQTLVEAVRSEDLPLAVGAFVFVGLFVLVAHLVADVLYAVLDPRLRY